MINVRSAETGNAIPIHGKSTVATVMDVARPNSGVQKTKETARMTPIAYQDWYVVAKTVKMILASMIVLTAVNSFLTYLTQVCKQCFFQYYISLTKRKMLCF